MITSAKETNKAEMECFNFRYYDLCEIKRQFSEGGI